METCARVSELATTSKRIPLADAAVAVWLTRLDLDAEQVRQCTGLLSRDEQLRAERFHFERDRRRFVAARGILRVLLGEHLGITPASIAFGYAKNGKPFIADHAASMHFNVAHAHERALYAISKSCALGVDIEYLNRDIDYSGLAERFFTSRERTELKRIPESDRKRAFFSCWTRKEAVIKATGDGLSLPLNQFEVTLAPGIAPRLLDSAAAPQLAGYWNLYAPDIGNDYIAAVAAHHRV